jgi:hypothetical protein
MAGIALWQKPRKTVEDRPPEGERRREEGGWKEIRVWFPLGHYWKGHITEKTWWLRRVFVFQVWRTGLIGRTMWTSEKELCVGEFAAQRRTANALMPERGWASLTTRCSAALARRLILMLGEDAVGENDREQSLMVRMAGRISWLQIRVYLGLQRWHDIGLVPGSPMQEMIFWY